MVCVLINAISVKEGGSIVVLRELAGGICQLRPNWELHVVGNSSVTKCLGLRPSVTVHSFPRIDRSFWRTRLWYETGLLTLSKKINADVLYSQTNYLPSRRPRCKTLLLEQHAGHFSPLFQSLMLDSLTAAGKLAWKLKGRWVHSSVRRADAITVQTQALARQISEQSGIGEGEIRVIPHGIGQSKSSSTPSLPPHKDEPFRIGYTTKYGVQKNFEVLFDAGSRLMQAGLDIRIVLTLCPSRAENQVVLRSAERYGISENIENCGELNADQVSEVLQSLHAFVFPSLVESFGFPMVEAMANGLPLLAADTASNREVAGDAGNFFAPHDAECLGEYIRRLVSDSVWYQERAEASLVRQRQLGWEKAATSNVDLIESLMR